MAYLVIIPWLTYGSSRVRYKHAMEAAHDEKRVALERQQIELTGSAEAKLAMQEKKEKEARIEYLKQSAMRRMKNAGVIKGWSAWVDMWEEKVQQRNMLKQAAGRLIAPQRSAAFKFWRDDMDRAWLEGLCN